MVNYKGAKMKKCLFCGEVKRMLENDLAFVMMDDFAISKGHCEIITKRHIATFFDTTTEERIAIFELVDKMKKVLDQKYKPDGYNIGMNCGEAAGQSVMHLHVHLIPRYTGDVANPRGGVRGIIPAKQNYIGQFDIPGSLNFFEIK